MLGAANAKVTIVEFGDYQCPVCRAFWQDVEPRLRKEYVDTGRVKLIFADFPVVRIHPEAILAAMAVDCAGDQHSIWQYHDKVFREQGRDDEVFRFGIRDLKKWARDIGLEASTFNECLDSAVTKTTSPGTKRLVTSWASGARRRFSSTNRRVIAGAQPYPIFKKAIDDELKLAGESGR